MSPTTSLELFLGLSAIAAAIGPGYLLWLRRGPGTATGMFPDPGPWPSVDVVVPVHDEAAQIAAKIEDLRRLDYPSDRVVFWIVDGASRDSTAGLAEATARGDRRFTVLQAGIADKTSQLNAALRLCRADWILVTDADARLGPGTLSVLVRHAEAMRAGAVGCTVRPDRAHAWESLHWRIADALRLRESQRGCTSIVTAPCYLMRRDLVRGFPEDVVADDVHVAFRAAAAGLPTGFVTADVVELRSPRSIAEIAPHKLRKARAYAREVLRFLPSVGRMSPPARITFLWRAAQILIFPAVSAAAAAALVGSVAPLAPLSPTVAAVAGVAGLLAAAGLRRHAAVRSLLALGALLTGVLLAAMLSAPLVRQRASFPKLDRGRARPAELDPS